MKKLGAADFACMPRLPTRASFRTGRSAASFPTMSPVPPARAICTGGISAALFLLAPLLSGRSGRCIGTDRKRPKVKPLPALLKGGLSTAKPYQNRPPGGAGGAAREGCTRRVRSVSVLRSVLGTSLLARGAGLGSSRLARLRLLCWQSNLGLAGFSGLISGLGWAMASPRSRRPARSRAPNPCPSKDRRFDRQGGGELQGRVDPREPAALLQKADLGAVQRAERRDFFLREASAAAGHEEVATEPLCGGSVDPSAVHQSSASSWKTMAGALAGRPRRRRGGVRLT